MVEQDCFLSSREMERLRWASQQVHLAIERHYNKPATLANDDIYKRCYPIVLEFQDKLADIVQCFIDAKGISLVLGDRKFAITGVVPQPGAIEIHAWQPSEVFIAKTPDGV